MELLDRVFGLWRRIGDSRRERRPRKRGGRPPGGTRPERLERRDQPAAVIAFPADPAPAPPAPNPAPTAAAPADREALRQAAEALQRAIDALSVQAGRAATSAASAVDRAIESGLDIARRASDAASEAATAAAGFDEVTGLSRPEFRGTARPGATVRLFAVRDGEADAVAIGRTVAGRSDGSWSLVANRRLADGAYTILGTQTDDRGVEGPRVPRARIFIDTAGPRVVGLEYDPGSKVATVAIQDVGLGLGAPSPEAFRVTRAATGTLVPATVSIPTAYRGSNQVQAVTVVIQDDRPAPADGYRIDVVAPRLTDLAMNPLDGEFLRGFPTGNARPGGDFRARLYPFRVRGMNAGR